jgi:uncharacterized RDD family membrane protein YckC
MRWHYVEQGQQVGPVTDEELAELHNQGKITEDTLVWRSGLEQWISYRAAKAGENPVADPAPAQGVGPAVNPGEVVCVECGKIFPVGETIRHGNVNVCANCKPVFLQKLSEGATINPQALNYAPIITRFAAVFLDGIILGVVNVVMGAIVGVMIAGMGQQSTAAIALQGVLFAIQMAIGAGYETIMVGKYGATLGKMACKIKVVTPDGGPVGYGQACGRYFAKILSSLICLIGYIMACFDEEKRALHDRICGTRVVMK